MADPCSQEAPHSVKDANAYVYVVRVGGIVRYVGKGRAERMNDHVPIARHINRRRDNGEKFKVSKFYNCLAAAVKKGIHIEVEKLHDGLTDDEAFAKEVEEIANRPELWNTHEGGNGFTRADVIAMWESPGFRENISFKRRAQWQDENFRKAAVERMRAFFGTPERRAEASKRSKKFWEDHEFRERLVAERRSRWENPETRIKASEAGRKRWCNPSTREKLEAERKSRFQEIEAREKHAMAVKAGWENPESRARASASAHKRFSDPDQKQMVVDRLRLTWKDPEVRKKASEAKRLKWQDPEYRAKIAATKAATRAAREAAKSSQLAKSSA